MPLKPEAALSKDRANKTHAAPQLQHRHFAFIAGVIADMSVAKSMDPYTRLIVAIKFAKALSRTNKQFDRTRFLKACNAEEE